MSERGYKAFSENETRAILSQLVDALTYCHKSGVVHFDVKLDNILYEEETQKVTLIDFGLCDFMEGDDSFTKRVGSEEYAAIELYITEDLPFSGTKVDIYALGIVLFALLTCSFPFNERVN
jgi:serine/threonine protein kinase